MRIYILKDDYNPDGSRIYGVYSSMEKAQEAMEIYESEDNEYGVSCDSLDIESFVVQ